ncbi:Mor transcription activator family protein [Methylocaldum gracile subsp. desertum]|uniref:Mor transcription activator family protein n=1 Tax=Methylocaldum sp. GT1BW TaxID=3438964 RepID=UPI003DA072A5
MRSAATVESSLTHKPAEAPLTREERNARILTEWNGRNVKELIARYGLSRSAVYAIVGK